MGGRGSGGRFGLLRNSGSGSGTGGTPSGGCGTFVWSFTIVPGIVITSSRLMLIREYRRRSGSLPPPCPPSSSLSLSSTTNSLPLSTLYVPLLSAPLSVDGGGKGTSLTSYALELRTHTIDGVRSDIIN